MTAEGLRHALAVAADVADELRDLLAPACERIEVAGSIRRRRPTVKDIELVAVPRVETVKGADLWGNDVAVDRLAELLATLPGFGARPVIVHRADGTTETSIRMGDAYQARVYRGIPVDLFIVLPPADWGVILALRTGPGDWNQRIVTDCQRWFRRVAGGRVLHLGQHVPCPEEADYFRAVGQPWVDPWERDVSRVALVDPRTLT